MRVQAGFPDLLGGLAGTILGVLGASHLVDASLRKSALTRWATDLLATARRESIGMSWRWNGQRTFRDPTGLSHGTAGIALALDNLACEWNEQDLHRAAAQARAYERSAFDVAHGNWADYRLSPGEKKWAPRYTVAWCHGAAGIALDRLCGYELTADPLSADEARVALETTRRWLDHALEVSSPDFCLCHGIAGNLEILDFGSERLASDLALDATPFVHHALARYRAATTAVAEPLGLMSGLAGIGAFMLRHSGNPAPDPLTLALGHSMQRASSGLYAG